MTESSNKHGDVQRARLLSQLLKRRSGRATGAASIEPRAGQSSLPLSYAQERLWFLEQLTPGSSAYVFCNIVHLTGPLDVDALLKSYQMLVDRHEILRTRFEAAEGHPVQRVEDALRLEIPQVDLTTLPAVEARDKLYALAREEAAIPFDLARAPLMRIKLVKISDTRHEVLQTMHHIVYDGWSLAVLFRELKALYESSIAGNPNSLSPLEIQYGDYSLWQRSHYDSGEYASQLESWTRNLGGAPVVLDVPADFPRPPVQSYNGSLHRVSLNKRLTESLNRLAKQSNCTLFVVLLTAFKILLCRYTRETDILVGTPIAGRNQKQTEQLIGFFVNSLVLRTSLAGDPSVGELLERVRGTCAAAFDNQDIPFERIVEKLSPRRDLSHNPIFQVMFALQNTPPPVDRIGPVTLSLEEVDNDTSLFDITLNLHEEKNGIFGYIEYCRDLFEADRIARMADHFEVLLEAMVAEPERRITALELLPDHERRLILNEWNATRRDFPDQACIHELIERQAELDGEAPAAFHEGVRLSYAELDRRANQVAHALIAGGIGSNEFVGLCIERSFEMLIGIVGILKAGAAYLPLDPGYPAERLGFMLSDSGAAMVLSQSGLLDRLPNDLANTILFDRDRDLLSAQPDLRPRIDHDNNRQAYTIYTSGSTGQPKGVLVTHRNLVNSTVARIACYPNSVKAFLLLSSYSFDSSVAGIFWTLSNGGMLVLPPQDGEQDVLAIGELIEASGSSHLLALPSLYRLILQLCSPQKLKSLEVAIVAGEACPVDLVERHRHKLPGVRLFNEYGPTEGTVWCTVYEASAFDDRNSVPIGRPIPNMQTFILDSQGGLLPIGIPGELHIAGEGLARGYLNRPDLTAEKFIEAPLDSPVPKRLYRTGDLVRYRADGNIEFLGRIDDQVKIRGFRIELGEIENRLAEQAAVRSAIVVPVQDKAGVTRLAAYCELNEGGKVEISELREHVSSRLPEYMVPAGIVLIDKMPLTPNGKIDKQALPPMEFGRKDGEAGSLVEAATDAERILVSIWREILGVEKLGVEDNFFELGGDSILSIQIIARARQAGLVLKPRQVFEYQTIRGLAAQAVKSGGTQLREQGAIVGNYPLTPIQAWFFEHGFANPHHWNQPAVLRVEADFDAEAFTASWRQLLEHHDVLRSRFQQVETDWEATIIATCDLPKIEWADLSDLEETEQETRFEAVVAQRQAQLNLGEAPALNFTLVDYGSDRPKEIVIIMHHLLVDGLSWRILIEDLNRMYRQQLAGTTLQLQDKSSSYRSWGEALLKYASQAELVAETSFWQEQSADLSLPYDGSVDTNLESDASVVSMTLGPEQTASLLQDCGSVYRTRVNDLLLTALLRTINEWTGQDSIHLTLEGHGREDLFEHLDTSRTVGWFTTLFPVLLAATRKELGDDIKAVKEQLRAIPNHGIGYSVLRFLGSPEIRKQLESVEAPGLLFNYLGKFDAQIDSGADFTWLNRPTPRDHAPDSVRDHWLDFNALVFDETLHIDLTYNPGRHSPATAERLLRRFVENLEQIIEHCLAEDAGGYTPSDFTLANLDQATLDSHPYFDRSDIEDIYPLSPMQEGILFHSIDGEGSGAYIEQYLCEFEGSLEVESFVDAWDCLIRRHDILRTAFLWEGLDLPLQVVHEAANMRWEHQDWREYEAGETQARLESFLARDRQEGFSLVDIPLMRMNLIRIAEDRHLLVWTFHHLLMDGWCLDLVLREVFSHYNRLRGQTHADLVAPRPYKAFIAWLGKQDRDAARTYWSGLLGGFESPNQVLLPAPAEPGEGTTAKVLCELDDSLSTQFVEVAKQHRLTPNTMVQAAWAFVLGCYSNSQDVVFGATVSGRTPEVAGIEQMLGLFINTLPIRVRLDRDTTCLDLLNALQIQQTNAREFEYSSLARIQKWSDVSGGDALFESIVVYENFPDETSAAEDLRIVSQDAVEQTNYPLTIMASMRSRLQLGVSYDPRRFDREAIERLLAHMQVVIRTLISDVTLPCGKVSVLDEAEREQVIYAWNDTQRSLADQECVFRLVERMAESQPDKLALKDPFEELTYGELDRRAAGLAARLRQFIPEPGACAGVLLNRTTKLPVALYAIMKAGGAYLPMDAAYPEDRILYMLEDAAARVLITESPLAHRSEGFDGKVIVLDEIWDQLADTGSSGPLAEPGFDDLAYLIYTSGSTGLPKGVEITHRGLRNLVNWHNLSYRVTPDDRASLLAGLAFDASVWEIWPYLSVGASLHIPDEEIRLSPADTLQWMRQNRITMSFVPTPLAEIMLLEDIPPDLPLRYLLTGGDKLHSPPRQNLPFVLVNHYGPTENTVVATAGVIDVDENTESAPCIGRPIDNTRTYVLDTNGNPLPAGVPGELYISGIGLARGYRNLAEKTNEVFLRNPFERAPYDRMYKTGDLVRHTRTGELEFLGRIDHQVKIRGFRIELGEIESQLASLEYVEDALVVVFEAQPGDRKLVAYLVCRKHSPELAPIREHLQQKLPPYMVPTYFVFLDSFPLTPNGKIDRRALPAPEIVHESEENEQAAATNETEAMLVEIWEKVLGVEKVGIHSNFFELGGDSIISIQIVSRARQHGLALTTRQIFENPTIARLVGAAVSVTPDSTEEEKLTDEPFELTPIQHWFFQRNLVQTQHWNQAYLFTPLETITSLDLTRAAGLVVAHHDALRLAFTEDDNGNWVQRYTPPAEIRPTIVDLSDRDQAGQDAEIGRVASEIQARNRLGDGDIFQVALFELGPARGQRLLVAIHHLAVDGISWRILVEDLQFALLESASNRDAPLPRKTASFRRWSEHLHAHVHSAVADTGFWREQLAGREQLPVDRWRPGPNTVASAREVTRRLSEDDTTKLLQQASAAYNTQINDLLLTALARTLARWTGRSRHFIHLESHGREPFDGELDLSRTVGWFTSLFPVMLECAKNLDLPSSIVETKEKLRRLPPRGVSYGVLRYLSAEQDRRFLEENDSAQILFNYLGQLDQSFEAGVLLTSANESTGLAEDPRNIRSHLLEINCAVTRGQLEMSWSYSENLHRSATVKKLADRVIEELESIIAHCLEADVGRPTPSDFPLACIDPDRLLRLGERFEAKICDLYPLAPIQQGMLYHGLTDPDSMVSFEQYGLTLEGRIDPERVRQAWNRVVERHDALRTAFYWERQDAPLQFVLEQVDLPWTCEDLTGLDDIEASRQLEDFRRADKQVKFDLARPPLLRVALFLTGESSAEMIWTFHHIILDGWSMNLVLEQFVAAYHAGNHPETSGRARSYRNYIGWLAETDAAVERKYWRTYLEGYRDPTLLLDTIVQSEAPSGDGNAEVSLFLDSDVTARITALAREHGITANTIVQAGWGILIGRYCGSNDAVFGSTVSGRSGEIAGIEEIVGNFINIVPVRVRPGDAATTLDFLIALQQQQLASHQFEFTPLGDIQALSPLRRNSTFFDSLLVFENYPLNQQETGRDQLRIIDSRLDEMTNFPLNLIVFPGSQMRLSMTYKLAVLCESTLDRLLRQLATALTGLVEDLDRPVSAISIEGAEYCQPVFTLPMQNAPSISILQVGAKSKANEIMDATTPIGLAELHGELRRRIRWLSDLGLKPAARVVVETDDAIDMLLSIVSAVSAGYTVSPLIPETPDKQRQVIRAELQPEAWIGCDDEDITPVIAAEFSVPAIDVDIRERDQVLIYAHENGGYVNAAPVSGRTFVDTVQRLGDLLNIGAGTILSLAIPTWTATAVALSLATLGRGGRVHLEQDDRMKLTASDAGESGNEWIFVGPESAVDRILDPGNTIHPKKILCLADRLEPERLATWLTRVDEVWKLFVLPHSGMPGAINPCHESGGIVLGVPFPGVGFTVDAGDNRPLTGAKGRLEYRRVDQQGQAYAKVVSSITATYLDSGEIALLPETGSPVTDYGVRIDLSAVAAIARQHPAVTDAYAIELPKSNSEGGIKTRLYCAPGKGMSITVSELRNFLREELPAHSIPSELSVDVTMLDVAGGKLDPESIRRLIYEESRHQSFEAPRGEQEDKLAEIWREMLGIEQVSRNDKFFDLGGNSFMSMNLLARIRAELGCEISPRLLLFGTLRQIAETCDSVVKVEPQARSWFQRLLN